CGQAPPLAFTARSIPHASTAVNHRVLVGQSAKPKCGAFRRRYQCPVAKQQPLGRNLLRRCPAFIMRIATSSIDRKPRLPDEEFRSRFGNERPDCPGLVIIAYGASKLRCGPLVGAAEHLGSILGTQPSRSRPIFQAIFCVPEMWKTHGSRLATSALAT